VDHAVRFLGRRRDLPDVIAAFDVSVQASLSENYGGTIEALLMESPTVATRAGGIPEVIEHEVTGLLVNVSDPPDLAAGILRLIEDPDLGRRLAAAGRERMRGWHTIQQTADGVADVYRSVAQQYGISAPPLGDLPSAGPSPSTGLMPRDALFERDTV
jgi:glycosyltransferase involved in cell wall biosynthesis